MAMNPHLTKYLEMVYVHITLPHLVQEQEPVSIIIKIAFGRRRQYPLYSICYSKQSSWPRFISL